MKSDPVQILLEIAEYSDLMAHFCRNSDVNNAELEKIIEAFNQFTERIGEIIPLLEPLIPTEMIEDE